MKVILIIVIGGFLLDLLLGDPHHFPHPVRAIGWLIAKTEKMIRKSIKPTPRGEFVGGCLLTLVVIGITYVSISLIIQIGYWVNPLLAIGLQVILAYQVLATKSLKDESMKVYESLKRKDLEGARWAVSRIVGRDTACLDEVGIAKAAVETVAENTSDGVIGPLFYLVIGGVPLAYMYKAINTMDSMVGYQNDTYRYLGRCAAKLDDAVNYVPARLSAFLMIITSKVWSYDTKAAFRIYKRDRYNHKSPNSAHTEAACAGALNIQLAGDAYYFGKLHQKPTIGDPIRPIEITDIKRANQLLYGTAWGGLLLFLSIRLIITVFVQGGLI